MSNYHSGQSGGGITGGMSNSVRMAAVAPEVLLGA
jgi:hypothetical protein